MEPNKSWFAMSRNPRALSIDLMDEIGAWGISAKDFKEQLEELDEGGEIQVNINSPGGAVFDGIAIYNLLAQRRERVSVHVYGLAASIASVIALAGRSLTMGKGTMFMIHDPWSMTVGDAESHRKTADILEKIGAQIIDIYRGHTALTDEELGEAMKQETWYTAEDAVDAGFASSVVGEEAAAAVLRDFAMLEKFKNVPVRDEKEKAHAPKTEDSMEQNMQKQDVQAAAPETNNDNVVMKADLQEALSKAMEGPQKEIQNMQEKLANISMGAKTMPEDRKDAHKWFVDAVMNIGVKRGIPMDTAATVVTSDGFGIPIPHSQEFLINLNHYSIARRFGALVRGAGAQQTRFSTSTVKNAAALIAETGNYGELAEPGLITLDLYKLGGRYSLTEEAQEDTIMNAFAEFAKEAGVAVAKAENQYFLKGTGTNQPKGIFAEAATTPAASETAITLAELQTLDESLGQEWDVEMNFSDGNFDSWNGPVYVMNPATAAAIRTLLLAEDKLVFTQDGLGRLRSLFGRPVIRDANVDAIASDKKVVGLVNWGCYLIGERRPSLMLRVGADNDSHTITWDFNERVGGQVWDTAGVKILATDDGT